MSRIAKHRTLIGLSLIVLLVGVMVSLSRPSIGGEVPDRVTDLPRSNANQPAPGPGLEPVPDPAPRPEPQAGAESSTEQGRSDSTKFGTAALRHDSKVEAELVDVDASTGDGVESVTFGFAHGTKLPHYKVSYVDAVRLYADEDPIPVQGTDYLTVRFERTDPNQSNQLAFPPSVQVGQARIAEVLLYDNLSGSLRFAIGVNGKAPFRVRTLSDPLRMVVDFRNVQ